jgi:hypothetical protein
MRIDLLHNSVSKLATWYRHVQVAMALTATLKPKAQAHTSQHYLSSANNGGDFSMHSSITQ